MTVCIGALCDANDIENTANIVLCADTLVTYVSGAMPITSNPNGSKIFSLPHGFYCAIADDLTQSHIFVSKLTDGMRSLSPDDPALYDKIKLAIDETAEYIRRWRLLDILAHHGVRLEEYLRDDKLAIRPQIVEELANPEIPVELIIGGFVRGHPALFHNDGRTTHEQATLGFYAGGSGSLLAISWLNFRQQTLAMKSQRTFFHVLEAKIFAERNPTVGTRTFMLFMTPGQTSSLDLQPQGPMPSLITKWGEDFHVKFTEPLDKVERYDEFLKMLTPLTSRM